MNDNLKSQNFIWFERNASAMTLNIQKSFVFVVIAFFISPHTMSRRVFKEVYIKFNINKIYISVFPLSSYILCHIFEKI
jgi:uncharacterized PurR-regulated membrane protein YhhQ (DUF165 family)